jgi:hypothetical protein
MNKRGTGGRVHLVPRFLAPVSLNKYYASRKFIGVDIQDENGIILHSFDSLVDCAKFLDVDRTTISKRMKKGIPFFLFENKRAYIKKGSE